MLSIALKKQFKNLASVVRVSRELGKPLDISYDGEADVLYLSFGKPKSAVDSDYINENIIVREDRNGNPIGYTVLNASKVLSK